MVHSFANSPLDSLVDLACRDGVDIRPTLLRVITDLYMQKPAHTAEEETQYVELALGLIGTVDEATRAAVATRLGSYANAPRAVLQRLAATSAQPATPRQPEVQTAQPVPPAAVASPQPPAARLPRFAPQPASTPAHELIELFFTAGAEERRLILTNLDVVVAPAPHRQSPPAEAVIRRLESTAMQRNVSEFVRMLERGLSISRQVATRVAHDPSGEGIVVAAKALDMKADVLQRILLFLNPAIGQSVKRVFELAQLYEDITPAAAACMVSIWRQPGERLRPQHAPALWDDERAGARTRATPAPRRGQRASDLARPLPRTGSKPGR